KRDGTVCYGKAPSSSSTSDRCVTDGLHRILVRGIHSSIRSLILVPF
ncbi:uncharacterized protein METZ01_LOCUS387135, partial [marine metagenome]